MRLQQLEQAWAAGRLVPLAGPGETAPVVPASLEQQLGPGVIVGSGGSMGGRRWCVQPLAHLQESAAATGRWLAAQGFDPAACLHLNPLPPHHVSGLLPWVRSRQWGAQHRTLAPALMRDPVALAEALPAAELVRQGSVLLSLVPTQLGRLLADPAGVAWLQQVALIWVGGAPLSPELAAMARQLRLPLAPCYGATETAAMVCALTPMRFLAGELGCGAPLDGVRLRVEAPSGALAIATARLSPGWLEQGALVPLPRTADGWWLSGDAARFSDQGLQVLGRLDAAIHSGGETVFPEQVEQRLVALIEAAALPVAALLLVAESDPLWGARLVALVRLQADSACEPVLAGLNQLAQQLPPAQRPVRWQVCASLETTMAGKWQRQRWQQWLAGQLPGQQPGQLPGQA
jgi:O-succinylbenzoic acid--CoA ligase